MSSVVRQATLLCRLTRRSVALRPARPHDGRGAAGPRAVALPGAFAAPAAPACLATWKAVDALVSRPGMGAMHVIRRERARLRADAALRAHGCRACPRRWVPAASLAVCASRRDDRAVRALVLLSCPAARQPPPEPRAGWLGRRALTPHPGLAAARPLRPWLVPASRPWTWWSSWAARLWSSSRAGEAAALEGGVGTVDQEASPSLQCVGGKAGICGGRACIEGDCAVERSRPCAQYELRVRVRVRVRRRGTGAHCMALPRVRKGLQSPSTRKTASKCLACCGAFSVAHRPKCTCVALCASYREWP
jgi:hypothetical protein